MSKALILFAKAPEPGRVKTRLSPFLSANDAAGLQKAFILDLLQNTQIDSLQRFIACAPATDHPFFQHCKIKHSIQLILQEGKDLGERMRNAFEWAFSNNFHKVIIIGSDVPTLPPDFIRKGFDRLSNTDIVLGPSLDGGYYLIGARKHIPALFTDLPWGTETVLGRTLEILNSSKCSSHLLPFWYDIDRPEDLPFLYAHLKYLSAKTGCWHKATSSFISSIIPSGSIDK